MATVTVRNLPDEVHRALRVRAASNGRSTEAEIRAILESTVHPIARLRLGTALNKLARDMGLSDGDIDSIGQMQEKTPATPMRFE